MYSEISNMREHGIPGLAGWQGGGRRGRRRKSEKREYRTRESIIVCMPQEFGPFWILYNWLYRELIVTISKI